MNVARIAASPVSLPTDGFYTAPSKAKSEPPSPPAAAPEAPPAADHASDLLVSRVILAVFGLALGVASVLPFSLIGGNTTTGEKIGYASMGAGLIAVALGAVLASWLLLLLGTGAIVAGVLFSRM